jgi:uncharacterized protein YdeI (BOF family)
MKDLVNKIQRTAIILAALILSITVVSCGGGSNKSGNKTLPEKKVEGKGQDADKQTMNTATDFPITAKNVGAFVLGETIPESVTGFERKKETRTGEEASEYIVYVYYSEGEKALEIQPAYSNDKETDKIGDIVIFSGKFRTDNGLRVGSTIEDLAKAYPAFSLGYSYISDRFWFEQESGEIQFDLDKNSFIGKQNLSGSDWVEIPIKDFKPGTKVTSIGIRSS